MSKFYGVIQGTRGPATRCGSRDIVTSAQSYDGSVQTRLFYNDQDELMVEVSTNDASSTFGTQIFYGTFKDFENKLKG